MDNKKEEILKISGMMCVHCQTKIERALSGLEGVLRAEVSYEKGTARITYDSEKVDLEKISHTVEDAGYGILEERTTDHVRNLCLLLIIISLYIILQVTGLLNKLAPQRLADSGMSYGMLFIVGLLTSVHCIAMCGGINLSQTIPRRGEKTGRFMPAVQYNMGRVAAYTAIGGGLGAFGMLFGTPANTGIAALLQGTIKMIAGIFMIIMGISMLDLFPGIRKFTIRLPKGVVSVLQRWKRKRRGPFIVGLLNGIMPCGPLQAMWLVALATGNPLSGALSMFLFAMGTVPLMLGMGTFIAGFGKRFARQVMSVGAVMVVVLGLAMFSQGGNLSGWMPSDLLWRSDGDMTGMVQMEEGVQVVRTTLESGYFPNIEVKKDIPVRWIIEASKEHINGCNYKMMIRDYGIEHTFTEGENIIEFIPEQEGSVPYSCWMGMICGTITITDS